MTYLLSREELLIVKRLLLVSREPLLVERVLTMLESFLLLIALPSLFEGEFIRGIVAVRFVLHTVFGSIFGRRLSYKLLAHLRRGKLI